MACRAALSLVRMPLKAVSRPSERQGEEMEIFDAIRANAGFGPSASKPPSRLTDDPEHVYERINRQTNQRSLQIGPDQIAYPVLDENGRPTIEVSPQQKSRR